MGQMVARVPERFGFYGILTDPLIGYEQLTRVMVAKQVRFIQLRMKSSPKTEILEMAQRLRCLIPATSFFIVNDHADIAKEVGADGVHLGQDDLAHDRARQLLGPKAIIGLSTHNPEQTRAACALGPDYIGVGPVYATPTKAVPDPVIGLDGMRKMLEIATVPAVAIGGIDVANAPQVVAAGAQNICAVRCVTRAEKPEEQIECLNQILEHGA